jgi:uncharacterized membrane protein
MNAATQISEQDQVVRVSTFNVQLGLLFRLLTEAVRPHIDGG